MRSKEITDAVAMSLREDVGTGDITAALILSETKATAQIISREEAVICGKEWLNEVYHQIDPEVKINWMVHEGDKVKANQILTELSGCARSLVTGERTAINWLQTLSGTATAVAHYAAMLNGSKTQLLDTRKTIPGLRFAQKYAVRVGGGKNHRLGLYDAFLIKENHILSCGSISKAIQKARRFSPKKIVEIEVENIDELKEALANQADIIMLDNFSLDDIRQAVILNNNQAKLEVSGNINLENLRQLAEIGVDYISIGALTKHLRAVDLSMRFSTRIF